MEKVFFDLENCYGIEAFCEEFDFTLENRNSKRINAHIVYAPNGTMKTSLADTLKDIEKGKETKDYYFPERKTKRKIYAEVENGTKKELLGDDVFVIESYNEEYKSDKVATLLADKELKKEYDIIYTDIEKKYENTLKVLKRHAGINKDIDIVFTIDFEYDTNEALECLKKIYNDYEQYSNDNFANIKYSVLFNNDTEKIYKNPQFAKLIKEYINSYEELLKDNPVFSKAFNHSSADTCLNDLKKSGFFRAHHKVVLANENEMLDESEFQKRIKEAKDKVLNGPELQEKFSKIDSLFSTAKGREFRDVLLENSDLILEISSLDVLRRKLWVSYLFSEKNVLEDLIKTYDIGLVELKGIERLASEERTVWNDVIDEFNHRFENMPFTLDISNRKDVILKESIENITFIYKNRGEEKRLEESALKKRLSNGEKRALYLLNILFEVNAREILNKDVLLIIDDIADSFDYRNKYAIIEYLYDIVEISKFKVIILTHNFDFYRTVASRLDLPKTSHFVVKTENSIKLKHGGYLKNVFSNWKGKAYNNNTIFLASIPFIRNIVEYISGDKCNDYKVLTSLLHQKKDSNSILVKDIIDIYIRIWKTNIYDKTNNENKLDENQSVKELILSKAEDIYNNINEQVDIENKIVLSIAIRLLAEEYMINRINNSKEVDSIEGAQTRKLFNLIAFAETNPKDYKIKKVLESVLIITSENIHLNSFMYEPLVDISLDEYKRIYEDVKQISPSVLLEYTPM